MNATARVKLNGFDFDSLAPVNGNVYDEKVEQLKRDLIHGVIGYIAAIVVIAAGACLCQWWYYVGWHLMLKFFLKFAPWLMHMFHTGQV